MADPMIEEKKGDEVEIELTSGEKDSTEKKVTSEDVKAKGWSQKEIESAQKRGMIASDEPKKEEVKKETTEEKKEVVDKTPDHSHTKQLQEVEYTDEQFQALKKILPYVNGKMHPALALFARARNERGHRQRVQDELRAERAAREALENRLQAIESGKIKPEVDENGNEVDPEDKPLTLKQFRALEERRQEEIQRQQAEFHHRAAVVAEAQKAQEEFVKSTYPDSDEVFNLATEVLKDVDGLFEEKWKKDKAVKLIKELQIAAANADKYGVDEYNAAMIAYELGTLHPNYGKTSKAKDGGDAEIDGKLKDPQKKANGGLTPDQMKRIEEQNLRRASSASIAGASGGRRTVDAEDVTVHDLNAMSYEKRMAFRTKHPERYAKLMRG